MMATYRICPKHGVYKGQQCPECPQDDSKKSKKYGGKTITIPKHMRAGSEK